MRVKVFYLVFLWFIINVHHLLLEQYIQNPTKTTRHLPIPSPVSLADTSWLTILWSVVSVVYPVMYLEVDVIGLFGDVLVSAKVVTITLLGLLVSAVMTFWLAQNTEFLIFSSHFLYSHFVWLHVWHLINDCFSFSPNSNPVNENWWWSLSLFSL